MFRSYDFGIEYHNSSRPPIPVLRNTSMLTACTAQRRMMTAIEQCRTAALGGHVEQCDRCGHRRVRLLRPLGVEAALTAVAMREHEQAETRRQAELALTQARYEADLARRQYDAVDPANRLVAAELECRWNARLADVQQVDQVVLRSQILRVVGDHGHDPVRAVAGRLAVTQVPDLSPSGLRGSDLLPVSAGGSTSTCARGSEFVAAPLCSLPALACALDASGESVGVSACSLGIAGAASSSTGAATRFLAGLVAGLRRPSRPTTLSGR